MGKRKQLLTYLFIVYLAGIGVAQTRSQQLQDELTTWKSAGELEHASVGIYLQDAETGDVLAQTTPQLSLVPASTLKLITTATAIEILGADFRFKTQLAYTGEIRNDTLSGDLVIIGGGDPALGSKYFKAHYLVENHFLDEWTSAVKQLGIRHITGNVVTDATIFENQMVPNTWIWEDLGNYYGAGASGLSVYDNLYKIHFASPLEANQPTRIKYTEPFIPELELQNEVTSSNVNRDQAYVFGGPMSNHRVVRGTIPKGKSDFTIKASVPNPPYLLAWELIDRITNAEISIEGTIINRDKNQPVAPLTFIAETVSPPLVDIIHETNYESVNLFAEHLLKYLAYFIHGQGSTKKGIEVVTEFWKKQGIDMHGLFMADGSGLSHFNAITTRQMVNVLYFMKTKSPEGESWFNTLPYVPNGTLYFFHPTNFPGKTLRAKSGSMTRVRCYAGELTTLNGHPILFAIFLNNFSCKQTRAIQLIENLLVTISKY